MKEFSIAGQLIKPGERKWITLETASLYDFTTICLPVEVIRGKEEGPVLFVSAAIHGDEINGVDIIRRLLKHKQLKKINGTLIAIPIVNVFGFNTKSRYLPDRRDLNRCFPGSENGSLAAQLAYVFMEEIVKKSTHGIDLHTGAIHRSNLPQIRGCFDDEETKQLAESFGVPVMVHSDLRDGSLREAAREHNIPMLLFEGGEALRFNESVTRAGLRGILNVMQAIGMLEYNKNTYVPPESFHAHSSHWLRAPYSGIFYAKKKLGDHVQKDQVLGFVSDPFGRHRYDIKARLDGIVIGVSTIPLLNKGDAVFHVATFDDARLVEDNIEQYHENVDSEEDILTT